MFAILKREFKSYFNTVTGPLFVAVELFFLGLYFTVYHLNYGAPYLAYTVQSVLFVFLIIAPVLTMRSMAEERRQKTDQLLFTAPQSSFGIISGKYLGMVAVFMIPVLVLCLYPLFLSCFGHVGMAESYVAILGYFLFGCSCLAIGLFISSLTDNLIIAAVGTFGILLLSYQMAGIRNMISPEGNTLTRLLKAFDLATPLDSMLQGVLNLRSVIYYLFVIFIMLFYTHQNVNRRRYEFGKKTAGLTLMSFGATALVTVLLAGIYWASYLLPESYKNLDMTEKHYYELSDTSKEYLKNISDEVTIYVLSSQDDYDEQIKQLLYRYNDASPKLKVEYKSLKTSPDFATQFDVEDATDGSLIVVSDKRSKYIHYSDLFVTEMNYQTYGMDTVGIDAEGQITGAVDYVLGDDLPVAGVVTGHGEYRITGSFSDMLEKANIELRDVNLMTQELTDIDCLFLIAPERDYSQDDAKKVRDYLEAGGAALVISEYSAQPLTNFDSLVSGYGFDPVPGVVFEGDEGYYYQMPYMLLPNIEADTITSQILSEKRPVLMEVARGITTEKLEEDGQSVTKLLVTSDKAYAKADISGNTVMEREEGDVSGPFTLGLLAEKERDSGSTRILYFSSPSIMSDQYGSAIANIDLVVKGVTQLVGEHESSLVIPSKMYEQESIIVPRGVMMATAFIIVAFIPLFILITGIVVWTLRKKR